MSSRVSTTHATELGDRENARHLTEDYDWERRDIENTEYGTLLNQSQNVVNKKHDNPGRKCRQYDQRNQPTQAKKCMNRTRLAEVDAMDVSKNVIGKSTMAMLENTRSSTDEHLRISVVAKDKASPSSTSSMAELENDDDETDTYICKSRRLSYSLREKGWPALYESDDTESLQSEPL